ncbi:hypothetical protein METP3_01742 [Methanosarcinales archaeon]|nr:hypothetical protein METP3_01742 [Methanosarcinales archaeon]
MKFEELPENMQKQIEELKHGVMNIGGEIEYDLNSDNNGYFCPECQEEIEEVNLILVPEPVELG